MAETLKSLRFLYGILMTVSTVILVFALSPDDSAKYKSALKELAVLDELKTETYYSYVHEQLRPVEEAQKNRILTIAGKANIILSPPPTYSFRFFSDPPPNKSDLLECDGFFRGGQKIAPVLVDPDDAELSRQIKEGAERRNVHTRLAKVMYEPQASDNEIDGVVILRWREDSPATTKAEMLLIFESVSAGQAGENIRVPVYTSNGQVIQRHFGMEWLEHDAIGKELIDAKSGVIFPHLKEFWNQFGTLHNVQQIAQNLQQQLQSLKGGTVSFFGISIASSLVVVAGPIVCLAILLSFQLFFSQFVSKANLGDRSVTDFPWIPLVPGSLAAGVSYLSLFYPVVSNVFLLQKYGNWRDRRAWLGISATLLLALITALTIRSTWIVRRKMVLIGR